MYISTKKIFFLFFIFLFFSKISNGQQIFNSSDLSQFKAAVLSDDQILGFLNEVKSSGMTLDQAEKIAQLKGLSTAEITKLNQRIDALSPSIIPAPAQVTTNKPLQAIRQIETTNATNKIFGSELFSTASSTFQPDLKIATPVNYELGPDDQLQISIFGLQEASFLLTVSPEGVIKLPNVGEVVVSGYTVEQAREIIKAKLVRIYTSLRTGSSQLSINLGKIRSIRVTVLGSTKPGSYELSSLSSVFNLLYLSGGPALNGSYREIELIRDNKVEHVIDLYNFLLSGKGNDNVRLRENDIVRIPIYKSRVEIDGEIKRPGIYEILSGETITDLLYFTGGFTDSAYKASIKVVQITDRDKKVKDLQNQAFNTYHPGSGDYFFVAKVLNTFSNRITIDGAVTRPGNYEMTDNLTLAGLIKRADGVRADAYTERGQLIRLNKDLTKEIISFNLKDVLNDTGDIPLQSEDRVAIASIFELKDEARITIQGEVRRPDTYLLPQGLTLKDLILQAGGFTDAAFPQRIEIARVLKRDTLTESDKRLSQIINIRDLNDLSKTDNNVELKPFDVITVRRLPGYLALASVNAMGQVQFPGPYVLETRLERISDLLKRAGGLTPEAFVQGAFIRRVDVRSVSNDIKAGAVEKIQLGLKDSSNSIVGSVQRSFDQIPLDLAKIQLAPGTDADLILKAGDELFIPRNDAEIKISGEVLFPTQSPFKNSKNLKDYVSDAGGFTDYARKKRVYVIYPNGKAASTRHFLFFKSYPSVKPGSEIIIPRYIVKVKNHNTTEVVALATSAATLAYLIVSLIKL